MAVLCSILYRGSLVKLSSARLPAHANGHVHIEKTTLAARFPAHARGLLRQKIIKAALRVTLPLGATSL